MDRNGNGQKVTGLSLHLESGEVLRPLIESVVTETLVRMEAARAVTAGKLAYSEEEAARLLSIEPWVLRDERRRGRIQASQIVGNRIRHTHDDLVRYLAGRRWHADKHE